MRRHNLLSFEKLSSSRVRECAPLGLLSIFSRTDERADFGVEVVDFFTTLAVSTDKTRLRNSYAGLLVSFVLACRQVRVLYSRYMFV